MEKLPQKKNNKLSPAKEIAYISVMCALLVGGQAAMSFVVGVEVVTLLLLTFSYCFDVKCGMLAAIAFCLIEFLIWGFYPAYVLLYLMYYPLFALLFGLLGKIKDEVYNNAPVWLFCVVNVVLAAIFVGCVLCLYFDLIKISRLYKSTITALLWAIAVLCGGLFVSFNAIYALTKAKKLSDGKLLKVFFITTIASLCTICFTIIDDVITPLIVGMTKEGALTYFYTSFIAMLPQTICTIATVSTLFLPLSTIMSHTKNKA
jgi:hypothetical protein